MPFALVIVGLVLVVASVRNTVLDNQGQPGLVTLVKGDFTGQNNFMYWFVSILVIGALGYIEALRPISRVFLALVVVVLFLSKGNPKNLGGGFFQQFNSQAFGNSGSVSNQPVNLGGLPGTFTGNPSDLNNWMNQWPAGIEQPIAPIRPN